jgi:hypothetical protein
MRPMAWGKVGAVAGVLFVVLLVVGSGLVLGDLPEDDATAQELTDFWSDSGNQVSVIVGTYLLIVGALAFLAFMATVRSRLMAAAGDGGDVLTAVAFSSGVVFTAMLIAAAGAFGLIGATQKFGTDFPLPGEDTLRIVPTFGYLFLLVGGALATSLAIASTSWAILRTGAFARWLAWLGFLAAIVVLFAVVFLPLIALPIWVLAASFELWRRPAVAAA